MAAAAVAAVALAGAIALLAAHGPRSAINDVRSSLGANTSSQAQLTSVSRPSPIVYRPPGHGSAKLPLVVALYGFGGCPQCMEGVTNFEALARSQGFMVAYPGSTTNPPWNGPGDLAYVRSFIDQVVRTDNVDASRVYLTGFSAGGRATYQYGCALGDRLAGIAIVSSVMRGYPCKLRRPLSELAIVGSTEHAALYGNSNGIPSAAATAQRWQRLNACSASIAPQLSRVGAGGLVSQQFWGPCANGSRVGLFVVSGGYHTWPGTSSAHGADARFDASAAIWQFFSGLSASSLHRPDASLSAARGGSGAVSLTLRTGEAVTVSVTASRGRRRLASVQRRVGAGSPSLWLRPGRGAVRVKIVVRDFFGRRMTITRVVHA